MAQRKQLTWTELRVGMFVLAGLFILAVAIFYVTGAGILGPKYRLITYLPEVDQLTLGAPVRLDGIEIGNVQSMTVTPHPADAMHNITVVLRIDQKFRENIRTDSTASLGTEGLLGNRYVTVKRGLTGTVLPNNGILPGREEAAMKAIVERGAELMQNLGTLSEDLRGIVDQLQHGQGTIAKFINDPSLYNHANDTIVRINSMVASIQEGRGTVGKVVASDELYNNVNATVGDARDMLAAVREQKGTLGKVVYDPAMYDSAKSFLDKGNATLADIREGKGSLGKLATDDALYNNLRDTSANIRDASAKLNSNQGTLGKFFSDPAFYDNFTGMTGDLRLMISDFRQNPKKFLHVKMAIF